MPWEIHERDGEFCVHKKGSSTPIKGGCHKKRSEAVSQLKALYANAPEFEKTKQRSENANNFLIELPKKFSDFVVSKEDDGIWIQAFRTGTWDHPIYGETEITSEKLNKFYENFQAKKYGQDIPITFEHGLDRAKGEKAAGWLRDMKVSDSSMLWKIQFTEEASREVNDNQWRYFSPEWADDPPWYNMETGEYVADIVLGGSLTNRPVIKGMVPVNFSELAVEDEHAPEEHSEPGTGIPPEPRETPEEKDQEEGWRRDTPPPQDLNEEGDLDTLKELRTLLGLEDDANVIEAVKTMKDEVEPLRKAASEAATRKQFAEQFPDEARRLAKAEEALRESASKAFAEKVLGVRIKNKDDEETTKGFSALVVEKAREMHKLFSEGKVTLTDFEQFVEAVGNNGIVDYGEGGSSRQKEEKDLSSITGLAARKAFAEVIVSIQDEDKLSYEDAVKEATKRHPELAEAYMVSGSGS